MVLVVTKRPLLILLKALLLCLGGFLIWRKGGKKIKNECGQTLKIWLYLEFHLHFVASTNPAELLARDFLSLDTYKDAGKKLQCISRNRFQNEDKASGKTRRPGHKMELMPRVVKDHCGHRTDAETGCSSMRNILCSSCGMSHWAQSARGTIGTAGQGYPLPAEVKSFQNWQCPEVSEQSVDAVHTSTLIRSVRPAGKALLGQRIKINPRGDTRKVWLRIT